MRIGQVISYIYYISLVILTYLMITQLSYSASFYPIAMEVRDISLKNDTINIFYRSNSTLSKGLTYRSSMYMNNITFSDIYQQYINRTTNFYTDGVIILEDIPLPIRLLHLSVFLFCTAFYWSYNYLIESN